MDSLAARTRASGQPAHVASQILCGYIPVIFGFLTFLAFRLIPGVFRSPFLDGIRMSEAASDSFLLLGISFLARRRGAGFYIALGVALASSVRLAWIFAGESAGSAAVEHWFVWLDLARLSPMAAMGLIALSTAYVVISIRPRWPFRVLIEICGSIVLALGIGPAIEYLFPLSTNARVWYVDPPAIQVSIAFVLMGAGVLWWAWEDSTAEPFPRWLPSCSSLVVVTVGIYLWQALNGELITLHAPLPISGADLILPRLFLLLAFFIGGLVGWLLTLMRTSRGRESALSVANTELKAEIAAREKMEHALRRSDLRHRESEASFRLLFSRNPQPMWVLNRETFAFLEVNQAAVDHYGYKADEFSKMRLQDLLITPEDKAGLPLKPISLEDPSYCLRLAHEATAEVKVDWYRLRFQGQDAVLWVVTDVTHEARIEEKVRQTQKLEGIGRLAGGIAHDFNNLLTIIGGYAHLLSGSLAGDAVLRSQAEEVILASDRAAALVMQLLAFSRKQVIEPRIIDVNELVLTVDRLLRRLISEEVDLSMSIAPGIWTVRADPNQMEQVLINLALNARDAMPGGGHLEIATANRTISESDSVTLDCAPGDYVEMTVRDSGQGMPPEVIAHIFEPFFTTKGRGKGTGLGLAIVYGIVKQSGGEIVITSTPGSGTLVRVLLPRAAETELTSTERTPHTEGGTETILLAEDENSVRAITRDMLVRHGYRVLEAATPEEAVAICRTLGGQIHLLVTDVVMPAMSGLELANLLREVCPKMKVLFVSGYTEDAISLRGVASESVSFLPKPFTPEILNAKVREILAHSSGATGLVV
jgi:two-component system cell cycle sensor histidine kinase/response regulator CckA